MVYWPFRSNAEVIFAHALNKTGSLFGEIQIPRLGGLHRFLLRSEEHTSELQSRLHLVCRLLLEKKKKQKTDRLMSETNSNQIQLVMLDQQVENTCTLDA